MHERHLYLRAGGVSLLIDLAGGDAVIVHWGADLGETPPDPAALTPGTAHSMFDEPIRPSLLPQASRGWRGRPGLIGSRDSGAFSPLLTVVSARVDDRDAHAASDDGGRDSATLVLADASVGVEVELALELTPEGLLTIDPTLRNTGESGYRLQSLSVALPVPGRVAESLDWTGRWSREKHPQRRAIDQGEWMRAGRHGRTGHDASPLIVAGTAGFDARAGEVWALHLAWSGDSEQVVERTPGGHTTLHAAELLHAGEVVLAPGAEHRAPTVFAAWSREGLDGVSARFHDWMRARPQHPSSPRPVVLNTWEAVYFDHDLETLTELAETAAELGVERFVLDDGWFLGRRNDHAGLGDWVVDEEVWPGGLTELITRVHDLGLQFGLWVEPEMVNEDSELVRAHPDWVSGPAGRTSMDWRFQQVLDLANPQAFEHVLERLDALLRENRIDYLKWDQNRDQTELGHDGRASTHEQTLAAYRLFDELKRRHPAVEIESCSSGGGRVDLGILQRTDRVWASDTNDALERQTIQRGTQVLVPPELVGAHVGPPTSHTTARTHDIAFRAATALIGHFGIEWDIRQADAGERRALTAAIAFYRSHRDLIHGGRLVHVDDGDPATTTYGVVAHDRSEAVFVWALLASSAYELALPVRFPGLDPERRYRVRLGLPLEPHSTQERGLPAWIGDGSGAVELSGLALAEIGLPIPNMHPERALVFELEEVAG